MHFNKLRDGVVYKVKTQGCEFDMMYYGKIEWRRKIAHCFATKDNERCVVLSNTDVLIDVRLPTGMEKLRDWCRSLID